MRFFSFCLSLMFIPGAFAAMPSGFKPHRLNFSLTSEYFWTSANFDEDGNKEDFDSDYSYKNLTNSLDASYNFSGGWQAGGGVGFAYASSTSAISDRSGSEFTDVHVKGQKILKFGGIRFIPEVKLLFAINKIDRFDDEIITNESANVYQGGSWAVFDAGVIRGYGFAAYAHRDDGRSALMPWTVGGAYRGRTWTGAGELGGYMSVSDDEFINTRGSREVHAATVNGGSLRYYSVNPSVMELRGSAGYRLSPLSEFGFGVTQTLSGESTAAGTSILLSFSYNVDYGASSADTPDDDEPSAKKNRKSDFQPELEQYDESLFKEDEE